MKKMVNSSKEGMEMEGLGQGQSQPASGNLFTYTT